MGSPFILPRFGNTSTSSAILYCNDATYDPTSTSNSITGQWNLNLIGSSGSNLAPAAFELGEMQSFHIDVELTGVSNLNKQGQIHLFEDTYYVARYGNSTDTNYNSALLNDYVVQDLPKCNHYRSIEIANMDSSSCAQYHYIPLVSYADNSLLQVDAMTSNSIVYSKYNKNFGCIVTNAAVGTTLRVKYDMVIELAVENDYICDYPPVNTKTYVNPDKILAYLNSKTDLIINTSVHDHSGELYKAINTGSNRKNYNKLDTKKVNYLETGLYFDD
jgi:hypothetical protein